MLCKRHRVESAGFRCIGHESWSAPCAHVQMRAAFALPLASRSAVVPVTTETWRNSHATATGTSRRRIFDTSVDQLSAGTEAGQASIEHVSKLVRNVPCVNSIEMSPSQETCGTPVGARGKPFCGFPRSGGRVLCVHGSGSVHRLFVIDRPPARSAHQGGCVDRSAATGDSRLRGGRVRLARMAVAWPQASASR